MPNVVITTYLQNDFFCIRRLDFHGEQTLRFPGYQLVSVTEGVGVANGQAIHVGDNFLLPANEPLTVSGGAIVVVGWAI